MTAAHSFALGGECSSPFSTHSTFHFLRRLFLLCMTAKSKTDLSFQVNQSERQGEWVFMWDRDAFLCNSERLCVSSPAVCLISCQWASLLFLSLRNAYRVYIPSPLLSPLSYSLLLSCVSFSLVHTLSYILYWSTFLVFNVMPPNLREPRLLAKQRNLSHVQNVSLSQVSCLILFLIDQCILFGVVSLEFIFAQLN